MSKPVMQGNIPALPASDWLRIWATLPAKHIPDSLSRDVQLSMAEMSVHAFSLASVAGLFATISVTVFLIPLSRAASQVWLAVHVAEYILIAATVTHLQRRRKASTIESKHVTLVMLAPCALAGLLWGSVPFLVGTSDPPLFYLATCISIVFCIVGFWWTAGQWHLGIVYSTILMTTVAMPYVFLDTPGTPLMLTCAPLLLLVLFGLSMLASVGLASSRMHLVLARAREELISLLILDHERSGNDWLWEADSELNLTSAPPRMKQAAHGDTRFVAGTPLYTLVDGSEEATEAIAERREFEVQIETGGPLGKGMVKLLGRPVVVTGNFLGYRGVGSDEMAAMKAAESERSKERLDAIVALTSGLAHDFNNQLATIVGSIELADTQAELNDSTRKHLRWALESCLRARGITADLVFSSGHDGSYDPTRFDLSDAVDQVARDVAVLYPEVTIERTLAAANVDTDPMHCRRAVRNLIENACQAVSHRGSHGVVSLSVKRLSVNDSEIAPGGVACLDVLDNGPGIPAAIEHRLFEPFVTTRKNHGGTGLGLSVVRGFATQAGGSLGAWNEGNGARFQLLLPLTKPSVEAVTEAPDFPDPPMLLQQHPLCETSILVLEDNTYVSENLRDRLTSMGATVQTVATVAESIALGRTTTEPFDCFLTDILLPDGEGYQAAEVLLEAGVAHRVVYMSGFTETLPSTVSTHIRGPFIPKPFSTEELLAALRSIGLVAA